MTVPDSSSSSSSSEAKDGVFDHSIFDGPAVHPKKVNWGGHQEAKYSRFEDHWMLLREFFSLLRVKESEDETTDNYVDMLGPRGRKDHEGRILPLPADYEEQELILPTWEYTGEENNNEADKCWARPANRFLETPVSLGDDAKAQPRTEPETDKYAIATFFFLRARVGHEKTETSEKAVRLFFLAIAQFALCIAIVCLGSTEIDAGRIEVVVGSFCLGLVGICAQLCGIMGVLALNEGFLRKYWIASLWMLSMSVTYFYTEVHHELDNRRVCDPTLTNFSPKDTVSCEDERGVTIAALVVDSLLIVLTFLTVYNASSLMDSINDTTSLEDNLHVAKYFQIYTTELMGRLVQRRNTSPSSSPGKKVNHPY
eukprot:TRINITY_DN12822_c1_g1_i1.p1 TRINITY_DN12822_c1_g1~~TRINITY_DN12822_c1_g1_i1.p1  ORF type:complete len:369 (+),score=72.86 TRINITY_DN12822_c1_g1_i1:46-1152(+)